MTQNKKSLKELKSMPPGELKHELLSNPHYNQMFIELSKINEHEYGEFLAQNLDSKSNTQKTTQKGPEVPRNPQNDQNNKINKNTQNNKNSQNEESLLKQPNEGIIREIEYKNFRSGSMEGFEKTKDYISYGYDYVGAENDPQNVNVKLPISDYVYQLLCNPN